MQVRFKCLRIGQLEENKAETSLVVPVYDEVGLETEWGRELHSVSDEELWTLLRAVVTWPDWCAVNPLLREHCLLKHTYSSCPYYKVGCFLRGYICLWWVFTGD